MRYHVGMEITGPFLDEAKKLIGRPACWYLRYSAPKRNPEGTFVLAGNGRPVIQRHRPHYETKAEALADLPRIIAAVFGDRYADTVTRQDTPLTQVA